MLFSSLLILFCGAYLRQRIDTQFPTKLFASNFRSKQLVRDSGVILIDVENLRGKSGFSLSHHEILNAIAAWGDNRSVLVVDHGSLPSALWMDDAQMAVVFAGPSCKADDVIANDLVPYFAEVPKVTVVTADNELIQRCRRASRVTQQLNIMSPIQLLEDLEVVLAAPHPDFFESLTEDSDEENNDDDLAEEDRATLELLDHEIKLSAQLLEAEAQLYSRSRGGGFSSMNNKRRKKLKLKAQRVREKLFLVRERGSTIDRLVTDLVQNGPKTSSIRVLPQHQQNTLLARFEKIRQSSSRRREQTGDRVILAEQLRRQLLHKYGLPAAQTTPEPSIIPPGFAYALRKGTSSFLKYGYGNDSRRNLGDSVDSFGQENDQQSLRIVVVSDTHGMEDTLPLDNSDGKLPDGDLLLHLGDFAIDRGPVQAYLESFDKWLAKQPHKYKIVLRGNHDPRRLHFPISGATVVTSPQSLKIGVFQFYLVPFTRSLTVRSMPRTCDVVLSHVPPRGLLDNHYMYLDRHVGDITIRRGVERMKGGPPTLWLCGHIHEGRGSTRYAFVEDNGKETLLVNAANANAGLASRLDHGPAVVDIKVDGLRGKYAEIIAMDGQYEFLNHRFKKDFFEMKPDPCNQQRDMLLAVDLGLKTGLSLFNDEGKLLRFDNFQFESPQQLLRAAKSVLSTWEEDVKETDDRGRRWKISKIAIEGGDPPLRDAWHEAADGRCSILHVRPEEWRADLLLTKEKMDGEKAKSASRLIARQIVSDYGDFNFDGKFQTDMAESILLGLHVARRLGWISPRDPPVRRYSNGKVIVPEQNKQLV
jgi:predicted phosphodiesterase